MTELRAITPELAAEVVAALAAKGRTNLAKQLASAKIKHCTYDESADAGYIYLVCPAPSAHFAKLAAPVAETIPFDMESGINVDVDHDGYIYGIEFLSRPDVLAKLKDADAL